MKIPRGFPKAIASMADVVDTMAREMAPRVDRLINPQTMQGACGAVSVVLARAINNHGLGRAELEGVFNPVGAHAWVLVNGRFIVDLTYAQFLSDHRVYVVDGYRKGARRQYIEVVTYKELAFVEPHILRGRPAVKRAQQFAVKPGAFSEINERLRGLR